MLSASVAQSPDSTPMLEARMPDDLPFENLIASPHHDGRALGYPKAVAALLVRGSTAPLLRGPSAVVEREANFVINPSHLDGAPIDPLVSGQLPWNSRLFGIPDLNPGRRG